MSEVQFIYFACNISSTESDSKIFIMRQYTAIGILSIVSKSDHSDKIKRAFFQAQPVSVCFTA